MNKVIALDYDGTANTNIPFWTAFTKIAINANYDVYIVTMRNEEEAFDIEPCLADAVKAVICTNRKAKLDFCRDLGIKIDIWIDDFPAAVFLDANQAYSNVDYDYDKASGNYTSVVPKAEYGSSIWKLLMEKL
jgi:hypothetical protein